MPLSESPPYMYAALGISTLIVCRSRQELLSTYFQPLSGLYTESATNASGP
ncbi:hypothetical protein PtA15_8A468 [Puccinia triticina]|uniref:Uncharacterized protein n=1 Tax=Puccinia triticina TaxID=208348 RepID=A0ABY7CSC5_9BASI|nr:uncharacterized protein PtA15_8A468 [Puccinia triticina]WAQ87564.1 hypothetical protein PtA15_8A468 [Puccinia triticina]